MQELNAFFKKSTNGRFFLEQPIRPRTLAWVLGRFPSVGAWALTNGFLKPWKRVRPATPVLNEWRLPLEVDGYSVTASVAGEGPLVILVHGWSGGSSQLEELRDQLIDANYRVAIFDAPAHGASRGRQANLPQFVQLTAQLATAVGPPTAVVGHSLGALAAGLAVADFDEKCRLVLLAPMPSLNFALDQYQETIGFDHGFREAIVHRIEKRFGFSTGEIDLKQALRRNGSALLVHDVDDRQVPAELSRNLAAEIPVVEYIETRGLGHKRLLNDTAVIECVLQFLQRSATPKTHSSPNTAN